MAETQTALVLDGVGKPLKKVSLPIPSPKVDELLLKITAAGLNPMDYKCRDADAFGMASNYPSVIAFDVVGEIIAKGPNASQAIGTHVFSQPSFSNRAGGGLQEYTTVAAKWALPVPPNISDADASVFPINAITTGASLFSSGCLGIPLPGSEKSKTFDYASTSLVINGAGTNNGKLAIQYARIAGVGKIIGVASLSSANELKRLGATHVVDRKASDVNAKVRDILDDDLLYVYDPYNKDLSLSVSMLSNKKKGTVVHLEPQAVASEEVKKTKQAGFEQKGMFGSPDRYPDIAAPFYKLLVDWIESGQVEVTKYNTIKGLDAEKVNMALNEMRDGTAKAKWTIVL